VVEQQHPTTDAVEILHRRYFAGKPEMLALLEEERVNAEIAQAIYDLRTRAGLTQRQLAALVGTSASAICRLEDADYDGHSLAMLQRIATALGKQVELRFVSAQRAPAVAVGRLRALDEQHALGKTLSQYAQALLAILQVLGVQHKDIIRKLRVSQQLVSGWVQGTHQITPTQEQQLRTLLVKEAVKLRQKTYNADTAKALCEHLIKAMIALDGVILKMEKAYSRSVRADSRAALGAIESKLGFYAVEPITRAKLEQARDAVYAAMDDLQHIWPGAKAGAKARNRALKALLEARPTVQTDMPAYLQRVLDLLIKAFEKPDAGTSQRARGQRTVQTT
jgi:transcriptional regulator with XRE-family HTH domain